MRVQNLETGARDLAPQFPDRGGQRITAAERDHAKSELAGPLAERTIVWTSDKLTVAALTQCTGQQQQLPLAAAQFASGVKMKDPQKGLNGLVSFRAAVQQTQLLEFPGHIASRHPRNQESLPAIEEPRAKKVSLQKDPGRHEPRRQ